VGLRRQGSEWERFRATIDSPYYKYIRGLVDSGASPVVSRLSETHPFGPRHFLPFIGSIMQAGVTTTWAAIASGIYHMAEHEVRPQDVHLFSEEVLRFYMGFRLRRVVADDMEYRGCPFKQNDTTTLKLDEANRDPNFFDEPEAFKERPWNRHLSFSAGIHRCTGANMARLECEGAYRAWLKCIPNFSIDGHVEWGNDKYDHIKPISVPVRIG
jgi:cytochrome P450